VISRCVARLISAATAVPYVVRYAGVLMPVRNRLLAYGEASEGKTVRVVDHENINRTRRQVWTFASRNRGPDEQGKAV